MFKSTIIQQCNKQNEVKDTKSKSGSVLALNPKRFIMEPQESQAQHICNTIHHSYYYHQGAPVMLVISKGLLKKLNVVCSEENW